MKLREIALVVLIGVALFGFSRYSPRFLDARFLLSDFNLYVETGLVALGMTFVIVSGNIDLSVGSNLVLTGCLIAKIAHAGAPLWMALVCGCVIGAAFGAFNGLLVARLKLPSFLVTLGTMAAYRGAAEALMGPTSVKLPVGFKSLERAWTLGLPDPLWIFLFFALGAGILLHKTVFGRWVYAIGANESAAVYAGVPVERSKVLVFALTGLLCGIGGFLMDSRLGVARHDFAHGLELDAITIVVVGGTAISGGRGVMLGTALALVLIAVLKIGMGVADVQAEYQLLAVGSLLVIAALASNLTESVQNRSRRIFFPRAMQTSEQ